MTDVTREKAHRGSPTHTQGRRGGAGWRSPAGAALIATVTATVLFFLFQLGRAYYVDGPLDGNRVLAATVGALVFGVPWGICMWFFVWRPAGHVKDQDSGRTDDDPARHHVSVRAPGSPDEVMQRVDAWVERHDGRVQERTSSALHAKLGSRFSMRMWGGTRTNRLPLTVGLEVTPDGPAGCLVGAQFLSDEGWYLVRTSEMFRVYGKKFDALSQDLREHLLAAAPRS